VPRSAGPRSSTCCRGPATASPEPAAPFATGHHKRQNEALALGYVTARLVESTFIAIGVVSLLAVVTLRQGFATAPEFVWELSLGIYLMVKGFKPSGVERLQADHRALPTPQVVPAP
jgi:hypothetical protein